MNDGGANLSALKHSEKASLYTPVYQGSTTLRCPFHLTVIASALCIVHLLLPIERGFPVVRIGGYPITLTLLVSVLSFAILLIDSKGGIIASFPRKYVPHQLFVVWVLLIAALVSQDIEASVFVVFSYFATFILNFLIIYYLFKRGLRQQFVYLLCAVISVAALVGVVEGFFRYYLPFYRDWFLTHDYQAMQYGMIRSDFRALGTLGNPIIHAAALALAVPFALEIKQSLLRLMLICLLLLATIFAVSTTTMVMWLLLLVGFLLTSKRKIRFRVLFVALVIISVVLLLLNFTEIVPAFVLSGWSREFSFGNQSGDQFKNIQVRIDLFFWTLARFGDDLNFVNLLFGRGLKSTIEMVQALGLGRLATLDNQYTTLLLESGVLGLFAYLMVILNTLIGHRWAIRKTLHWYAVLSLVMAGLAFTTIYYSTFNFVWVASIAVLAFDSQVRRSKKVVL